MLLKNAHIKNFKGIVDWEINFKPGFNLIIGENGKGKTSALEALAVGLGGFVAGVDGVSTRHFSKDEIRKIYHRSGDGECAVEYCIPIEVSVNAEIEGKIWEWTRGRGSVGASRSTIQPRAIAKYAELISNKPESVLPLICYYGAGRVWTQMRGKSENIFRKKYPRTLGYVDSLYEASNTKRLLDWCVRMEQVAWQRGAKVREYEAAKKAVGDFMRYMDHEEAYTLFYDRQMEDLMYEERGVIQSVSDLSAGYQSLIWMVLDIAYRMALLNPFLLDSITDASGIVLIDELDMHLHPKWQWKVIRALQRTFPSLQFIATTHAPILFASENNIWLIDIDSPEIKYYFSHYGISVNTSITQFQGKYDLPEEVRKDVDSFYCAMDNGDYNQAGTILGKIENETAPQHPLTADLRAMYELETEWPED